MSPTVPADRQRILFLCGAGNAEGVRLSLRINEAEHRWSRIVLLDDDPGRQGQSILGVPIVGPFETLATADPACSELVNLVARTTAGRFAARRRLERFGVPFTSLVSLDVDTLGAVLTGDVTAYPHVTIGPGAEVSEGAVLFMGSVAGHGSSIGAGCVVAANAVLNARVKLHEGVYIGTNATVLPEISIGAHATVGAGSVVVGDVEPGSTVMGVPARSLTGTPRRSELRVEGSVKRSGTAAAGGSAAATRERVREVERTLQDLWGRILGRSSVSVDENFFDLGATSLDALRMSQLLSSEAGWDVTIVDLFRYTTVEDLARHVLDLPPGPVLGSEPPSGSDERLVPVVIEEFAHALSALDVAVGPDTDFYESGGDAESARRLCEGLLRRTGRILCHMQVESCPTPRRLAGLIGGLAPGTSPVCPARGIVRRQVHRQQVRRRPPEP